MKNLNTPLLSFVIGSLLGGSALFAYSHFDSHVAQDFLAKYGILESSHSHDSEVHVHSDFLFYALEERIRFTDDRYQSTAKQVLLKDMHFHDNNDEVIHRHANGLTLGDFFTSLGVTVTNDCLTLDTGRAYCTDETNSFLVYVNGEKIENPANHINQQNERILFYYGPADQTVIETYQDEVTTDSCIYSGLCPERGTPPPEACGLTCEV